VKRQYVCGHSGRVGILSYAICDVCVGADVSDAWECTPHSICVHDSDSLQVKRQYARGRPGRVGMFSCASCELCAGADVSDA
jgi:hypothetical protein